MTTQWLQRKRFRWLTDSQRVTWTAFAILAMFSFDTISIRYLVFFLDTIRYDILASKMTFLGMFGICGEFSEFSEIFWEFPAKKEEKNHNFQYQQYSILEFLTRYSSILWKVSRSRGSIDTRFDILKPDHIIEIIWFFSCWMENTNSFYSQSQTRD